MIECTPYGICSWNYRILTPGRRAEVRFLWASEEGDLLIDGEPYRVKKDGWLSGRWRLIGPDGRELLIAEKPSAFHRSFEIRGPGTHARLSAESAFSRVMVLDDGGTRALISPVHAFTRRAGIHRAGEDFKLTLFAFWLTVLTWRRRSQNNSSSG